MITRHVTWVAGLALVGLTTLAACGDDGETGVDAGVDPEAGSAASEIKTADTDLGTILVDGQGRTLYLFTNDSPGVSTCEGECLDAWPPLEGEVTAGDGADAELLGTIERSDGTTQATYGDWPLYYFAQDAEAGDVKGQAVNDVWYVVSPDGEPIEKAPAPESGGDY